MKPQKSKKNVKDTRLYSIYSRGLLSRNVVIPITGIGKNIEETIENSVKNEYEGKCSEEGYVRPHSIKIITHSSGRIDRGNMVQFDVVFECDICFPVEGMLIACTAVTITEAGIRAISTSDNPTPIMVFLAKEHHYNDEYFSSVKEGDSVTIRVIGQRFELNDKWISIIAELVKPKQVSMDTTKNRPLLVIEKD